MKITKEQLAKAREAKSAEELITLAKAEGIEASEEEIKAQFDAMHKEGELGYDELDNVSGGGCGGDNKPTKVNVVNFRCPSCGGILDLVRFCYCSYDDGYGYFDLYDCRDCGKRYRQHENGIWTKN